MHHSHVMQFGEGTSDVIMCMNIALGDGTEHGLHGQSEQPQSGSRDKEIGAVERL